MEAGKKKIRICLISMVITAVVVGIFYYYYQENEAAYEKEGTLIRKSQVEINVM